MTWKRVATAGVLIPFVVGIVLWGSTALLALAVALVTLLALFEYFALGAAIGHRAYRFWTATCALLLIFVQWLMADEGAYRLSGDLIAYHRAWWFANGVPGLEAVFFLFVLGSAALGRNELQRPHSRSVSFVLCHTVARLRNAGAAPSTFRHGNHLGWRYCGLFRRQIYRQTRVGAAPEP